MKTIDLAYLKTLNPCKDRLDNYAKHHESFSGNLSEFLDLENTTHLDKLWVYFRAIDFKLIPLILADFAETVLPLFETRFPNDDRPRKAIEAARNPNTVGICDAVRAAYFAACAVAPNAARATSDVSRAAIAASEAARIAYDVYSLPYGFPYVDGIAIARDATDATYASYHADGANVVQEKIQIEIMKKYLKVKNEL